MSALYFVDTLIWTTLVSAGGLLFLVLKDEGFFARKPPQRKRSARAAVAA